MSRAEVQARRQSDQGLDYPQMSGTEMLTDSDPCRLCSNQLPVILAGQNGANSEGYVPVGALNGSAPVPCAPAGCSQAMA